MKWFLNLPYKVRIISALVFTALAFAAIGLTYEYVIDPKQPTFAVGEEAVEWELSRFPLIVNADDYVDSTKSAIDAWNRDLGDNCKLFKYGTESVDIHITMGSANDSGVAGVVLGKHTAATSWKRGSGPDQTILVQIHLPQTIDVQYSVLAHELGHALGLAHRANGVMYPKSPNSLSEGPVKVRVSDKNVAAIRKKYCNQ